MLLELAAANAAFSVIKEAVANSGDIMAAGESLFKYFDTKAEIQKKASAFMGVGTLGGIAGRKVITTASYKIAEKEGEKCSPSQDS